MNIREFTEEKEFTSLSQYATKSRNSIGRKNNEAKCDIRTCFQRDRDRIVHSKSFRRLMYKTQVFISPEGDHFRTRLTHTLEVLQVAKTIGRALSLNEDLIEAIAFGHDLGHTPFGHLGEDSLNEVIEFGFEHNKQSIRVVEVIEKNGDGLNLTKEVLDGIINHRGKCKPSTLEGKIVQISDKIAYINHDIDDSIRAGIIKAEMLPQDVIELLGYSNKNRIDFLIRNIIENSFDKNDIIMEEEVKSNMHMLRKFLFQNVYKSKELEIERNRYYPIVKELYLYYLENFDKIPEKFKNIYVKELNNEKKEFIICDYVAGMTDRFAFNLHNEIFSK